MKKMDEAITYVRCRTLQAMARKKAKMFEEAARKLNQDLDPEVPYTAAILEQHFKRKSTTHDTENSGDTLKATFAPTHVIEPDPQQTIAQSSDSYESKLPPIQRVRRTQNAEVVGLTGRTRLQILDEMRKCEAKHQQLALQLEHQALNEELRSDTFSSGYGAKTDENDVGDLLEDPFSDDEEDEEDDEGCEPSRGSSYKPLPISTSHGHYSTSRKYGAQRTNWYEYLDMKELKKLCRIRALSGDGDKAHLIMIL
jgi:hypothetical protein